MDEIYDLWFCEVVYRNVNSIDYQNLFTAPCYQIRTLTEQMPISNSFQQFLKNGVSLLIKSNKFKPKSAKKGRKNQAF